MTKEDSWWPADNKKRRFLQDMLAGKHLNTLDTIKAYNIVCPNARASELRKIGWPIRTEALPHPTLAGETLTHYYLDSHFIGWFAKNDYRNPALYVGQEGRGKFAEDNKQELVVP